MEILYKPLLKHEVKKRLDKDGFLTVCILVDFYDILENDLEGFNNLAEEKILEEGIIFNIKYKVISTLDESIVIQVTAEIDEY